MSGIVLLLYPMRVAGREHLPQRGPYILAANHIDWKDPPAIEIRLGIAIRFMAKVEAFAIPVLGGILRAIGCFPVRRGQADRRALETCLDVLRAGNVLGYFPEGTRSREHRLRRAHPGIGFLAVRSGVPVVPVAVTGTPEARPFRSSIVVTIGEPFRASQLEPPGPLSEQAVADAIMRSIAALLPPEKRGAYA